MVYKIRVIPKHERIEQISSCCSATTDRAAFYEYQNSVQQLPVIRVPIELPIYRMANGRTRTEQLKYIRLHQCSATFFSNGQENQDAQQAQHELLDAFSKEGTTSIMPIAKVLEEGKQTEPILITSSGVVVNGNRRLSAMRELYAAGDSKYSEFTHINCMVLPASASDKEIKEIEVITKIDEKAIFIADYKWQQEALTNILKNAIEHSQPKSNIYIIVENTSIFLKIKIKDEGQGIAQKDLKHIFERFYKAKNCNEDSIGIGLSLAKTIIEQNNGYIKATSEVGKGTLFEIKYIK